MPKKQGPPWLGRLTGIDRVLARLDEIEAKIDQAMTADASLKASLEALKAADVTIDAIEPSTGANPK